MERPVFQFRKGRNKKVYIAGSANGKPASDGTVCVTLYVNNVKYGPVATDIYCFRKDWDGRQASRPSKGSEVLMDRLSDFQRLLEAIHADLFVKGKPADGELILKIAKGEGPEAAGTLAAVYSEFMVARESMIEHNRRKRSIDQISEETYKSYPKRWAMIELYLFHDKRGNIPIGSVNYASTTRFKEFLRAYRSKRNEAYASATINKAISFLKMLVTYAQSKGYAEANVITNFACRGGSAANPKPLSDETIHYLEACDLPETLRLICDSWLIVGELCLHYSDYMKLRFMPFITYKGGTYIQNERSKQRGTSLVQTVNVTERAARLLAKNGGPKKLYYKTSGAFSNALKQIAYLTNLRDADGNFINLQFGQGRDTGLTNRAKQGANAIQLSSMAGWSNPREARRYLGDALGVVAGFVERSNVDKVGSLSPVPFTQIYKAS